MLPLNTLLRIVILLLSLQTAGSNGYILKKKESRVVRKILRNSLGYSGLLLAMPLKFDKVVTIFFCK